jgi:hypothetical protein
MVAVRLELDEGGCVAGVQATLSVTRFGRLETLGERESDRRA